MKRQAPNVDGIRLKKQFGQHFLRQQSVVDHMVEKVSITPETSIFEIGCGDGFLTRTILQTNCARLWIFEIDPDWAQYVTQTYPDKRLTMYCENILDVDWSRFDEYTPWTLLANLPYQVTFPILHMLQQHRRFLKEGVVMVQEEVAQKIVQKGGRGYGFVSVFFQYYFDWQLMDKIRPGAFYPPPKVDSRLLYFKPRTHAQELSAEDPFWKFVKACFKQPRRTLKNNLQQSHYDISCITEDELVQRAQQMSFDGLYQLWQRIQA